MDEELRSKILTLLDQHRTMTVATLRQDGWPQATTVGYANDGLTIYFLCGLESQKAKNLARDDRIIADHRSRFAASDGHHGALYGRARAGRDRQG
jgi:nitroimidazol reductase NimA-like FMN-containing flavoprotein (pyridoxamine 5'-phosphate oxidase superfamily)